MKTNNKYSEREWEEIASYMAGERTDKTDSTDRFLDEQGKLIKKHWTTMEKSKGEYIDTDKAWISLRKRLEDDGLLQTTRQLQFRLNPLLKVAAAVIVIVSLAFITRYLINSDILAPAQVVVTSLAQKNINTDLPDGSTVILNRNSRLEYPKRFSGKTREVMLTGEAYFDITPDAGKPFVIDAGNATVKVIGTSFNVKTNNPDNQVEVYVTSGKVLLTSENGSRNIILEPGFVGAINDGSSKSLPNSDVNYMAWNTEVLVYNNNPLSEVIADLKEVYDISVETTDKSILDETVATTFSKNSPETIIEALCTAFHLDYKKVNDIYYLSR